MGSATAVQTFGVARLAAEFEAPPGYLAAASTGILPRPALAAMVADLERSARGQAAPADYDEVVADTRQAYAALVDVPVDWVATASQTSTLVANVAAGLPDGAEVLVGVEEFASVVLPFTAGDRLRIRTVPLATLAESITTDTALVAFSLVQSATGEVLPGAEIAASARRHGALTLVDLTQAAGALPVRAGDYDFTVCHTYKWLCTPRGVAFLTICPEAFETVVPVAAGWYSADEPWRNCYWPDRPTSRTARVFDTAPAWEAFVGARASISMFRRPGCHLGARQRSGGSALPRPGPAGTPPRDRELARSGTPTARSVDGGWDESLRPARPDPAGLPRVEHRGRRGRRHRRTPLRRRPDSAELSPLTRRVVALIRRAVA